MFCRTRPISWPRCCTEQIWTGRYPDEPSLGKPGEWLIRRGPDAVAWEHGHQKADVALRGPAVDLLLVLLRRIPLDDGRVEILGDAALLEHWVRHVTF